MVYRFVWGLAVLTFWGLGWADGFRPAAAQAPAPRLAFVAGYAAYAKGPLKSALNDAGLVAESLRSIGFEVAEAAEPGLADFQRRYGEFLGRVTVAGPEAIAFVYLSGYGISLEGENYLLPSDARIERESDVGANAIRISDLLTPLAAAKLRARVLVVDAARPLTFRLQGRPTAPGFAAVQAPNGALVAFASGPGTVGEDGRDPYGVYATAIAEMIREPGRELDAIFTRVRTRTHEATQGRRTPWHSAAINERVLLVPGEQPDARPSPPLQAPRGARPMREIGPDDAYSLAIELDTIEGYAEFLEAYPRHPYGRRLFQLIRSRREALAFLRAMQINTPQSYWTYLQRYPRGLYAFDADRKLRKLSSSVTPPADFKPIAFDDVPPPLSGEPEDYIGGYDDAPVPPVQLIEPAPALFQRLPAPRPRRGALPQTVSMPPPSAAVPLRSPPAAPEVPAEPQPPVAAPEVKPPVKPVERRPQAATPPRIVPDVRRPPREPLYPAGPPMDCRVVDGIRYCRW